MIPKLPATWQSLLSESFAQPSFKKLLQFLQNEHEAGKVIYPSVGQIFRALTDLDLNHVKVVILGQDPYHGPGQAIGYSFAVPNDLRIKPPSLKNIFKEIESDLNVKLPIGPSDLTGWVDQGVLLLNTVLTVEAGAPLSHRDQGWEQFTESVIEVLNHRDDPLVFILWGSQAQKFKSKLNLARHAVLESAHPSPLSAYRGFLGSKVFSKTNQILDKFGKAPIDWSRVTTAS